MRQLITESEFQETDLGIIPADWRYAELGPLLADLRNGLTENQQREHGEYAVTRIETISQDRINPEKVGYVNNLTDAQVEIYLLRPRDILFSHINSEPQIGRSVVYGGHPPGLLHGMNLLRIRVDESRLNSYFLSYLFAYYRTNGVFIKLASRAVNQSSINQGKLKSLRVFLPSLPEQRRIAAVLNIIQDAIAAQEDVIAAAKTFKRSLMQRLFTYGPGREPAETKETEIGEIPAHWEVKKLGDVSTLQRGFDLPKQDRRDGNVPIVSSAGISGVHSKAKVLAPGVVTGRYGTIGDVYYIETDFWPLNTTLFVNDFHGNHPRFVARLLERTNLGSLNDKTSIPGINRNHAHQLKVGLPPLGEQNDIDGTLVIIDAKIAAEEDRLTALEALFKSMLHQLMTGQTRLLRDEVFPLSDATSTVIS